MIIITAKKDGFRRCGVAHPATTTEHKDDAFTEEQLEELLAEPMLVVQQVDDSAVKSGSKDAKKESK
jgi:hypothetical protein